MIKSKVASNLSGHRVDLSKATAHVLAFNDLMKFYDLFLASFNNKKTQLVQDCCVQYTFVNDKLNRFSIMDFICVTSNLKGSVNIYCIIDNPINHSDHLPVQLSFVVPITEKPVQKASI